MNAYSHFNLVRYQGENGQLDGTIGSNQNIRRAYNIAMHDTSQLEEMLVDDNSPDENSRAQNYDDAEGFGESDEKQKGLPKINQNQNAPRSHSRNRLERPHNFGSAQKKNPMMGSSFASHHMNVSDSDSAIPQARRHHPAIIN